MLRSRLLHQFLLVAILLAGVVLVLDSILAAQLGDPVIAPAEVRRLLWAFAAVIVFLLVAAGVVQAWIVSGRINRVLRAIEGIRKGEYPRLMVEGKDEVAELMRGFNRTVEELQSRDQKLKSWAGHQETELVRLSETLEEERERLETVLDSIGDGVVVLDSENKVLMANRRVAEIFGLPLQALTRADLGMLIEQVRHRLVAADLVEQKLQELQKNPGLLDEVTLELDEPGGQAIRLYCAPVRGADGKILGRIATSLDLGRERELDRLKSEFISTISHELRTPLTSVKGSLGLIRGGAAGNVSSEMKELLDIALTNTDRLIHVINDILDIFQLERGQVRMRPVAMSIGQSLERAQQSLATQAARRQVQVECHIPADLPKVQADPRRVEQVLVNLLSNAIKFSPAGQKVVVKALTREELVQVSVQDFGKGMSQEFLSRLFEKFEHSQTALTRESQGAGLGLAICRHIVEAHGGQIWAESEVERGSTFYFTLPAADRQGATPLLGGKTSEARLPARRLILVIDDDEDVARIISYIFESQGHRVIAAHNGREAIELARKHRPDMLTLDLMMPEVDGYAVLNALRKDEGTRNIPIICLSVEADPSRAMAEGADYFLEKPLDIDKLRHVAERALAAG